MNGKFDLSILIPYLPDFLRGTITTLWISALALLLALVVGLGIALMRISSIKPLKLFARGYTDVIRGTPALIQIFFVYFGAPSIGIRMDAWVAGVLGLAVNSSGYIAEIVRSSIESIDHGQTEAARALGMSAARTIRRIILPQTFLRVIPPITGEATNLVKGTSLLSVISIGELTRVGNQIIGVTFRPIEAYLGVALIYLVINATLTQATIRLERRLALG